MTDSEKEERDLAESEAVTEDEEGNLEVDMEALQKGGDDKDVEAEVLQK